MLSWWPARFRQNVRLPNFADTSDLKLVGSTTAATTQDGAILRLVPAKGSQDGAVTLGKRVQLGSNCAFSASFQFRITDGMGDGFTFALSRFRSKLGVQGGEYLGFGGDGHSLAVTFDTFQDAPITGTTKDHRA